MNASFNSELESSPTTTTPAGVTKIGFIISSNTQLEVAEEIVSVLRCVHPHCVPWAISRRSLNGAPKYDLTMLRRTFARIITPATTYRQHRLRTIVLKAARSLLPGRLAKLLVARGMKRFYPDLLGRPRPNPLDFVFTLNDRSITLCGLIGAFKIMGVPIALLQESVQRDQFETSSVRNGQGGCDVVYAWGKLGAQYYQRVGVSVERIVLAGSPRMDRYARMVGELPAPETIKRMEGLPLDRPVVLLATNRAYRNSLKRPMGIKEYLEGLRTALAWCAEIGAFALLKPHFSAVQEYNSWGVPHWVNSLPQARYRDDIDITLAIKASDAVLVHNSTVAFEARLQGKPVGMLSADGYSHGVDYLETGICQKVGSKDDLEGLLTRFYSAQDPCIDEYLAVRGCSAELIVRDMLERCAKR